MQVIIDVNKLHRKIVKPNVNIAKNYLKENELEDMEHLVNAVIDMAERMAKRHIPINDNGGLG